MKAKNEVELKWSLFRRKDTKRFVLTVAVGASWKGATQITAPWDIKTQRAADAWAKEKILGIKANGGKIPSREAVATPTLRDLHEELMLVREKLPDRKKATLANNWTHLRAQILNRDVNTDPAADVADIPMAAVDVARARRFVRAVRARTSPNHCRNVVFTCRTLWDTFLGERKLTIANPFRHELVIAELPKQRNVRVLLDDPDPIAIPLRAVNATLAMPSEIVPLARRVRLALAVTEGLDDGEIAGLQWSHFRDLESDDAIPFVAVRQILSMHGKDGYATLDAPKTDNRVRDIPLHPASVAAIREWRSEWERLMCRRPKAADFVFASPPKATPSRPLSASLLRTDLAAANARALGLGEAPLVEADHLALITFKATRRTFSTALKAAGVDEEDRGKLMGHSGSTVTARNYTRHALEELSSMVAKIPIDWPDPVRSVRNHVRTEPKPAQSKDARHSVFRSDTADLIEEARIGFEPTYDGFAKRNGKTRETGASQASPEKHGVSVSQADGPSDRCAGDLASTDAPAQAAVAAPHKPGLARAYPTVEVDGETRLVAELEALDVVLPLVGGVRRGGGS